MEGFFVFKNIYFVFKKRGKMCCGKQKNHRKTRTRSGKIQLSKRKQIRQVTEDEQHIKDTERFLFSSDGKLECENRDL
jgi:hypothetical protein